MAQASRSIAAPLPRSPTRTRLAVPGPARLARGGLWSAAALACGGVAASLSMRGRTLTLIGLAMIVLPLALRAWPVAGVVILVLSATAIEHIGLLAPQIAPIGTDEILYFQSLSDSIGLTGVLATPLELTMAVIVTIILTRAILRREIPLLRSPLTVAVTALLAIVALEALRGLAQGADLRTVLRELRPWVYLGAAYYIASQLVRDRKGLSAIVWAFVLGAGLKGIQGTYRYLATLDQHPRLDYVISHEDAVFLTLFILLTVGLWLYGERGRLRQVATALLPAVIIADLGNNRRTAWLIMPAGLVALMLIAWIRLPERRRLLTRVAVAVTAVSLVYVPLFWHSSAVWAQPVRAVRSAVAPDQRDLDSNTYRKFENANLMTNIKRSTPLGLGFGVPIDYSAIPFQDLADSVPALRFVPHNDILWVWMVLGIPGALAFWWLIGVAFSLGGRLARAPDPRYSLFGGFAACALLAYLIEGYYDFGLWWFRVAVLMGCVLGAVDSLTYRAKESA